MRGDNLTPAARYVRSLGDYYRVSEAAAVLEVGEDTLRTLAKKEPKLGPVARTRWAGGVLWLYTAERITDIHEHLKKHPPRKLPKLWTPEEYRNRQSRSESVRYYKRRAKQFADAGKPARAATARRKATEIADELDRELRERAAQVGRPRWF